MSPETLRVERIASLDDLAALQPEWEAVQAACPTKHVLLDHRWVHCWWRHFGAGKRMHTAVVRRGSDAVGIAPLGISRGWETFPLLHPAVQIADDYRHFPAIRWRPVPIRRLAFPLNLPSGNIRGHFLFADDDPALLDAVLDYCAGVAREWDMAFFEGLPPASRQGESLRERSPAAALRPSSARFVRTMMRASLPRTMKAFLAGRSGRFRRYLRKECRRVDQRTAHVGDLIIREYRGTEIDAGMDALFALAAQSWKVDNTKGRDLHLRLDDKTRAFHRDVARVFAATDQAQVLVLAVGDRPAVALYSVERDGVTACVLTYMAADLADRVTATPLWRDFVERSIAQGLTAIDFNGETRNLVKWADAGVGYARVVLFNRHPYSQTLAMIDGGARWLAHRLARHGATTAPPPSDAEETEPTPRPRDHPGG